MNYKFKIKNLDCASWAEKLESAIKKIKQIDNITINFMTEKMILECKEEDKEMITNQIRHIIKKQEPDVIIEENEK